VHRLRRLVITNLALFAMAGLQSLW
jgi:hypothetical protein